MLSHTFPMAENMYGRGLARVLAQVPAQARMQARAEIYSSRQRCQMGLK